MASGKRAWHTDAPDPATDRAERGSTAFAGSGKCQHGFIVLVRVPQTQKGPRTDGHDGDRPPAADAAEHPCQTPNRGPRPSGQSILYAWVRPPDCRRRSKYAPLPRRSIARNNAAISGSVGVGTGTVTVTDTAITWDHSRSSSTVSLSEFPMARSMNVCSPGSASITFEPLLTGISTQAGVTSCRHFKRVFIPQDALVVRHVLPGERNPPHSERRWRQGSSGRLAHRACTPRWCPLRSYRSDMCQARGDRCQRQ